MADATRSPGGELERAPAHRTRGDTHAGSVPGIVSGLRRQQARRRVHQHRRHLLAAVVAVAGDRYLSFAGDGDGSGDGGGFTATETCAARFVSVSDPSPSPNEVTKPFAAG